MICCLGCLLFALGPQDPKGDGTGDGGTGLSSVCLPVLDKTADRPSTTVPFLAGIRQFC